MREVTVLLSISEHHLSNIYTTFISAFIIYIYFPTYIRESQVGIARCDEVFLSPSAFIRESRGKAPSRNRVAIVSQMAAMVLRLSFDSFTGAAREFSLAQRRAESREIHAI